MQKPPPTPRLIESESTTPVTPEIPGLSGELAIALREAGL
jgi:hypothetical protein